MKLPKPTWPCEKFNNYLCHSWQQDLKSSDNWRNAKASLKNVRVDFD